MKEAAYNTNTLTANRAPENRCRWRVNADGYVTAVILVGPEGCQCVHCTAPPPATAPVFVKAVRARQMDPMDVVWPALLWPVDADGRGWSVLEVERAANPKRQRRRAA